MKTKTKSWKGKKQTTSKNWKLMDNFMVYCYKHPEERFWQSLRNWAKVVKVYVEKYNRQIDDDIVEDTFEFKSKNK